MTVEQKPTWVFVARTPINTDYQASDEAIDKARCICNALASFEKDNNVQFNNSITPITIDLKTYRDGDYKTDFTVRVYRGSAKLINSGYRVGQLEQKND